MSTIYRVDATGLNLRSEPSIDHGHVIAVLPMGHRVEKLGEVDEAGWWHVNARLRKTEADGFVASRFLRPVPSAGGAGQASPITAAHLFRMAPNARRDLVSHLAAPLTRWLDAYAISAHAERLAHFLAQAAHETDGFRTLIEYGTDQYFRQRYGHRSDLGNRSDGDGPRFKGRGIFQLTGRANYQTYGRRLGLDLETSPDLAADPSVAVQVACLYWTDHDLNAHADNDNTQALKTITLRINGGYTGYESRRRYYQAARSVFG